MADLPNLSVLHAKGQRDRIDLLKTDLALCHTFAEVAITEMRMNDRDAAQRALAKSEEGYATVSRLAAGVDEGAEKDGIDAGLAELRARLDALRTSTHL